MNLSSYPYTPSESFLDFIFESEGPKGKIKKVVRYSLQNANGVSYCNLGFGDLNLETGKFENLIISDNKDRSKILATAAATVLAFTEPFPDMMVYARGSTPVRTRLYQIGISTHWKQVKQHLVVFGYAKGKWEPFKKAVNYDAFFVLCKKFILLNKTEV